jgi:TonB-dependent receptor
MFADSNYSVEKGRLSYAEDSKLSDTYDATERLVAAYLMTDLPFNVAGLDMRIITGARFEQSLQRLNSYSVTDDPVQVNQDLLDILPAFNLIVKPSEQANIRLSASQTLARPSLREFAPFQFFDFQQQATIAGNPNLRRTLIQNFDIRYEYFPGPGEVLSVSTFYKRFGNAIEETLFPQQSEIVRSFANASGAANNYGIELEVRKSLGFIAKPLSDFMVTFNGALITSEITVQQAGVNDTRSMWGQSPYTVNMSVFYANPNTGTSVTFGYNTYGRRIIQVNQVGTFQGDPHVYELPRDIIDLSVIQPVSDNLEVKLVLRDLLNQPLRWEQEGALIQSNIRGMGVSLGFGYRIKPQE